MAVLVTTAALSASSLATPFPIHRVLSTVWFAGRSSASKPASKSDDVAGLAAEPRAIFNGGQPASERTASKNEGAQPEMRLAPAAAESEEPPQKVLANSSSALKRANSSTAVEIVNHRPSRALRPSEVAKEALDLERDQSRPNAEYDSLTRR